MANLKNTISKPTLTTTLLLVVILIFLFNFNIFNGGAQSVQIYGQGTPGKLAKWLNSPPPPILSNVSVTMPAYCSSGPGGTISWTYSDPNSLPQSGYRVQVDDDPAFGSPNLDSCPGGSPNGTCASGNTSTNYAIPNGSLVFNTTYYARVMAWNAAGSGSSWVSMSACNSNSPPNTTTSCIGGTSWRTPTHAYPQVSFTKSPLSPSANSPVTYTDGTVFQGAASPRTWVWNFGDSATNTTIVAPPAANGTTNHTYATNGSYVVKLTATDDIGQSCTYQSATPIGVQIQIPVWREVAPR